MRKQKENALICILMGFMVSCLTLLVVKNEKTEMYKIELDKVTIWCDKDGAVQNATEDKGTWRYRAVLNVSGLRAGDQLECYDLSTDVIAKEKFTIKNIKQDCWLCTE